MYASRKLFSLIVIRQFTLHPNHIRVRRISNSPVDCTLTPALIPVVPFSSPRCVPIPMDIDTSQPLGKGSRLCITLALGGGAVLLDQPCLIDMDAGIDSRNDCVVEKLEVSLLNPCVFNVLQGFPR